MYMLWRYVQALCAMHMLWVSVDTLPRGVGPYVGTVRSLTTANSYIAANALPCKCRTTVFPAGSVGVAYGPKDEWLYTKKLAIIYWVQACM